MTIVCRLFSDPRKDGFIPSVDGSSQGFIAGGKRQYRNAVCGVQGILDVPVGTIPLDKSSDCRSVVRPFLNSNCNAGLVALFKMFDILLDNDFLELFLAAEVVEEGAFLDVSMMTNVVERDVGRVAFSD